MISSNPLLIDSAVKHKPTHFDCAVWIDANDYSVGTFANGAAITNKGNNGATFVVVGSTLEVQLNGAGQKEFEFNGSYINCTSTSATFTQYHSRAQKYSVNFLGKLGSTSNPDAFYVSAEILDLPLPA